MNELPWIKLARAYLGLKEVKGAQHNPPPSTLWEKLGNYDSLNGLVSATVLNVKKNTSDITTTAAGVTANTESISLVNARLNDPSTGLDAQAGALQQLTGTVSTLEGEVTAQGQSINQVTARGVLRKVI